MKVALVCNRRVEPQATDPDDIFEEFDSPGTIGAVARALGGLNVVVEPVEADRRLPWRLEEGGFDFAFNIAEGLGRRCREAIPAAVCELLGLPFTGSDAVTLGLTLDKFLARRVVSPEVPVAAAVLVASGQEEDRIESLQFPVVVKPNDEGSSKGIRGNPLAFTPGDARRQCCWLQERYGCPVLVEEFLPGMEVTVALTGNGPRSHVLGMMEIAPANPGSPFVYSLDVKRDFERQVCYRVPPRLPEHVRSVLACRALTAYRLLGCRDFARLDFRFDAAGEPRFLECNPLPGLNPHSSDLVILSRQIMPYERLVQGILLDAAARYGVVVA